MVKKFIFICLLSLVFLANLVDKSNSAVQHTVSGVIVAANCLWPYHPAEPAAGAFVRITNLTTHATWETYTNSLGYYSITVTNPGNYRIEACGEYDVGWTKNGPWFAAEFYHNEDFTIPYGQTSISLNFDIYYGSCGINGPNNSP